MTQGNPFSKEGREAMFNLVDFQKKGLLDMEDLKKIVEYLRYSLSEEDLQEVINNVAGFGKSEISWEQFNKYIARKVEKK